MVSRRRSLRSRRSCSSLCKRQNPAAIEHIALSGISGVRDPESQKGIQADVYRERLHPRLRQENGAAMMDYEIGYRKPPKRSQFKPGVSGNPKGRRGRKRRLPKSFAGPRTPLRISKRSDQSHIRRDDSQNAHRPRRKRSNSAADHCSRFVPMASALEMPASTGWVSDWLPDRPGQTADQKTKEFRQRRCRSCGLVGRTTAKDRLKTPTKRSRGIKLVIDVSHIRFSKSTVFPG